MINEDDVVRRFEDYWSASNRPMTAYEAATSFLEDNPDLNLQPHELVALTER